MATYAELLTLSTDSTLTNRIKVACIIAANDIRLNASSTPREKDWAKSTFTDGGENYKALVWIVLAINKDLTAAAIQGATDAQVQTAVNTALALYL